MEVSVTTPDVRRPVVDKSLLREKVLYKLVQTSPVYAYKTKSNAIIFFYPGSNQILCESITDICLTLQFEECPKGVEISLKF